jgi:hypothetical protein
VRRGHHYGTILADLQRHRVSDLLPARTAAAFAAWLQAHGQPQLICRDRSGDYAHGARQGAPDAVPITDRFPLTRNSSEARERILVRPPAALRAAVTVDATQRPEGGPSRVSHAALPPANPRRDRRLARYQQVIALHQQDWSLTAIGAHVRLARPTVRKYANAGTFPEWPARRRDEPDPRVTRLCGQAAARSGGDRGGIDVPMEFGAGRKTSDKDDAGEAADVRQGEVRSAPQAGTARQLSTESVPELF